MRRIIKFLTPLLLTAIAVLVILSFIYLGDRSSYLVLTIVILFAINFITSFFLLSSPTRHRVSKLSWLFILWSLPAVGLFLFSVFGLSPMTMRRIQDFNARQQEFSQSENFAFTEAMLLKDRAGEARHTPFTYAYATSHRPVYLHNHIELLESASETLEKMLQIIRQAKKTIHVQYYILRRGHFFSVIGNELIKKAREGVQVRVLYDWIGSFGARDRRLLNHLREAGAHVGVFNLLLFPIQGGTNYRNHRKAIIADNQRAITGGINLGDEYLSMTKRYGHWRDVNVFLEGEAVNTLNVIFATDWKYHTGHSLKNIKDKESVLEALEPGPQGDVRWHDVVQVIDSGPDHVERQLKDLMVKLIAGAKKRVWLTTPYLLLTDDLLTAIKVAALSGVDVRLIVPGAPDNKKYMLAITRSEYQHLLPAGVKIYEYATFTHAKMFLFDDDMAMVGTHNLDFRSFYVNFETAVMVKSRNFSQQLERAFLEDMKYSRLITSENVITRGWLYRKIYLGFLTIFHPLL